MIEEPKPLTIKRGGRRPTQAQVQGFAGVPTSFVADALGGAGNLSPAIKPMLPGLDHAVGPALTVGNQPGDILASLGALSFIQAGDIVVASNQAHQGCASAGDRLVGMMKNCQAAGFVTDGPLRDHSGVAEVGLPVWGTGLNPASPFSNGPGRVGLPIQIGGQQVDTGDIIVADRDGVVVVPFDQIDATLTKLATIQELEHALDAEVAGGLKCPPKIADLLASEDVEYLD